MIQKSNIENPNENCFSTNVPTLSIRRKPLPKKQPVAIMVAQRKNFLTTSPPMLLSETPTTYRQNWTIINCASCVSNANPKGNKIMISATTIHNTSKEKKKTQTFTGPSFL